MDKNEQVDEYISSANEDQIEILSQLRELIISTIPDGTENFKWKRPVYTLKKDFCYLQKNKHHINFGFINAEKISDSNNLLEGTGKSMRHIKIKSVEKIDREYFIEMLKEAVA